MPILYQGNKADETTWATWTWSEYRKNVDNFAKSLIQLDFNRFDIINIIGFNAPEWFFANFGAIMAGGIAAGIYATNGPDACKYQAKHSSAKIVVVEGLKQLEKFYAISKDLPKLKAIVMYGPDELPDDIETKISIPVYTFSAFLRLGKDVSDAVLKARGEAQDPNQVTTLIYTSG